MISRIAVYLTTLWIVLTLNFLLPRLLLGQNSGLVDHPDLFLRFAGKQLADLVAEGVHPPDEIRGGGITCFVGGITSAPAGAHQQDGQHQLC